MSNEHNLPSLALEVGRICTTTNSCPPVQLHLLCQECSIFCKRWDVLDWLQMPHEREDRTWPPSLLCSMASLFRSQDSCHLCKLVLASLERRRRRVQEFMNMEIYLYPRVDGNEPVHVSVRLAQELPTDEETAMGKYGHYPSFALQLYTDSDARGFQQHITAKEVPLRAKENLSLANSWIQSCLSQHDKCQEFHRNTVSDRSQRPTRILEVTQNTIRLRCDLVHERYDYLVLSHMWGQDYSQQLRLLNDNLMEFQENVPLAKLEASSTFKEAIQVTRILRYQYLWIDSLCIIQDSKSDWNYEAQRMAIVYGNAICNLAFLFPPQKPIDTKPRDDPRIWSPCILRAASNAEVGIYIEHLKSSWRLDFHEEEKTQPWLVQRDWPLFTRAWTFQEYLLSSRTLLIGQQNLMWHCSELFHDEMLGSIARRHETTVENPKRGKDFGKSRYFPTSIQDVAKASTTPSLPSIFSFMEDWQNLINEYRARKLTKAEDRIIAFAGIACGFQHFGNLTYLAGAWKEVLPHCLLWYVDKKVNPHVRREYGLPNGEVPESLWTAEISEHIDHKGAPAWSWFSVPIYRAYQLHFLFDEDERFVRSKSYLTPPIVHWDDIFWAQTESYQFPSPSPPNHFPGPHAFSSFANLSITLTMPVLPTRANWPADIADCMLEICASRTSDDDASFRWYPSFEYFPDVPAGRKSPPKRAIYAIVAEFQTVRVAGKYNVQRRLAGLMLVPGPQSGTWTRVGAWRLRIKISDVPVDAMNMEAVSSRWREYSVLSDKWTMGSITLV